ncbi:MAG: serine hydrolase [Gemmatimonadales bacterium]|nr:serine hydrolase [Gemmatimonadales bacterium]
MRSFLIAALVPSALLAQTPDRFDYWTPQRVMIQRGQQAVLMCNGLFTSHRTLEQIFDQELKLVSGVVGTARGGDYTVDQVRKAVAIGLPAGGAPTVRAAYREGIGCVVMAPDQTFDSIDELPRLSTPPLSGDPATIPWPNGDKVESRPLPAGISASALQAASDWSFNRSSREQITLSLLVVHKGQIIHERYAPGVNVSTRTRTWSTAKSIASTLIGILVDQGKLALDEPLGIEWLPKAESPADDPRNAITLRHVLNMASGLYPIDNAGLEYATGSGMSYWAGVSSVDQARDRALIRKPGTSWDYENYDTILATYRMKLALGSEQAYLDWPRKALFDRIGMRNTLVSTDRFGDFILSSQIYTNARDLARFGLLYLNNGVWDGQRIISEDWIRFVRTPAPSSAVRGHDYGGQFWLVPDNRKGEIPANAYATRGNRGQYTIIVPSHDLVIVRRGLDYGRQGFDAWDLTREVLKAFPTR